jgi:hypothetical protein
MACSSAGSSSAAAAPSSARCATRSSRARATRRGRAPPAVRRARGAAVADFSSAQVARRCHAGCDDLSTHAAPGECPAGRQYGHAAHHFRQSAIVIMHARQIIPSADSGVSAAPWEAAASPAGAVAVLEGPRPRRCDRPTPEGAPRPTAHREPITSSRA